MYTYKIQSINRIVDGDTVDVTLDLGFDILLNQRVRLAGIDSPEKRTRNKLEKQLGLDATSWLTNKLNSATTIVIKTSIDGSFGKYGRVLGWLFINDDEVSLNDLMIKEGYAWVYDGGSKEKNFDHLIQIRKQNNTIEEKTLV